MFTNLKCQRQSQSERARSIMPCEHLQFIQIQSEDLAGGTEGAFDWRNRRKAKNLCQES